ncbi:MAG: response regulator [Ilumatobacteraceae bacterium]
MDESPKRVVVSAAHRLVAEAVGAALRERGFAVVATTTSADALLEVAASEQLDAAVVCDALDLLDAPSLFGRLRAANAGLPVLAITVNPSLESLQRSIDHGAAGYLGLDASLDENSTPPCRPSAATRPTSAPTY